MGILDRTLLNIINEPVFLKGDGNWINIVIEAVVTASIFVDKNNVHDTIKTTAQIKKT